MNLEERVDCLIRAWNIRDEEERNELIKKSCTPEAVFINPSGITLGADKHLEEIKNFCIANPGAHVSHGKPTEHHAYARWWWSTLLNKDEAPVTGEDFAELDSSGLFKKIVSFWGPAAHE